MSNLKLLDDYLKECSFELDKKREEEFNSKYRGHCVYWSGKIVRVNKQSVDMIMDEKTSQPGVPDLKLRMSPKRIVQSSDKLVVGKTLKFRGCLVYLRLYLKCIDLFINYIFIVYC